MGGLGVDVEDGTFPFVAQTGTHGLRLAHIRMHTYSNSDDEEEEESLRQLYARAMVLEYDFFAEHWQPEGGGGEEWRGIDPGALVGLVCLDCLCGRACQGKVD